MGNNQRAIEDAHYDVFLSFQRSDTGGSFTNVLSDHMDQAALKVFVGDDNLTRDQIVSVMHNSKVCIPIFSKTFASSEQCLWELMKMLELKKQIYPIFYDVTTDDVKLRTHSVYNEFMEEHITRYGKDEVEKWKKDLKAITKIKGREFRNTSFTEFCQKFVGDVLTQLKPRKTFELHNVIDIEDQVQDCLKLLDIDNPGVRYIAICGMGGIGKTILAKCIFNKIEDQFHSCSFLEDVRESVASCGNEFLMKELWKSHNPRIRRLSDLSVRMNECFRKKKVLVVLDDVDKWEQIEKLVGTSDWFGPGSRIIVTTRNSNVMQTGNGNLNDNEVQSFEMKLLGQDKALQLLNMHAFKDGTVSAGFEKVSREAVDLAAGLPLALEKIGSRVYNRPGEQWEEIIERLKEVPEPAVKDRLRISYDALEYVHKQIFLDIACFFIDREGTNPIYMWEACGYYPKLGLEVLRSMSLVKVLDDGKLWMHGQLGYLGRDIVREESIKDPTQRSRLWEDDRARKVFMSTEDNEIVEAVRIERSCTIDSTRRRIGSLENLRFLELQRANLKGDFEHVLPDLRWFSYHSSQNFKATKFPMTKLVILDFSYSGINENWCGWSHLKDAKSLKVLDLTGAKQLTRTPYFPEGMTLERLILKECNGLVEIGGSIGNLGCLRYLNLTGCVSLPGLPEGVRHLKLLSEILMPDGRAHPFTQGKIAESREEAEGFAISACREFAIAKGGDEIRMSGLVGKNILLYFSAHRSSYSRHFLPSLIKAYHEIKARDGAFEVIFISCDEDEDSFHKYFSMMPWLALPFQDARIQSLYRKLEVTGIPTVIALGPTDKIITKEAYNLIITYGSDAYPFTDEHIGNMAKGWPRKLLHALHGHELVLSKRIYICDRCNIRGHVWSYFCKACDFDLHPKCAFQRAIEDAHYDVFLSFQRSDTGGSFTDVLCYHMDQAALKVFVGDDNLTRDQIVSAMNNSKVCIPIFSKTFASSEQCLWEVKKMSELKKPIFPIFYDVTTEDVKLKTPVYNNFMPYHVAICGEEKVEEWKKALRAIPKIKGREVRNKSFTEFCQEFVGVVLSQLKPREMFELHHVIEIEDQVQDCLKLLDVKYPGVRYLAICGMGGIGKTILAKCIFNKMEDQFDSCSFLEDVRESVASHGIEYLMEELKKRHNPRSRRLYDLSVRMGECFRKKKILVVLDDVDKWEQIEKLVGRSDWFGSGSRILVTTRNSNVMQTGNGKLNDDEIRSFEMGLLGQDKALQLFNMHAFKDGIVFAGFEELSREAVALASGLPLALEKIGSRVCNRPTEQWEEIIERLKEVPEPAVKDRLRISYDALEYVQKQIFLDIACFFIDSEGTNPIYMWEACGYYPNSGLEFLRSMSLLKVLDDGKLWMHAQLGYLGRDIVREESIKDPTQRSRLWEDGSALKVFKNREDNEFVEAVRIERSCTIDSKRRIGSFENLRFLELQQANLKGDFEDVLPDLRWLSYHSSKNFELTKFPITKLVILDFSYSGVNENWYGWSHLEDAKSLKVLDLSGCKKLTRTPYFPEGMTLERLILKECNSLVEIDGSIGNLGCLQYLNLTGCVSLPGLPEGVRHLKCLSEILMPDSRAHPFTQEKIAESREEAEGFAISACREFTISKGGDEIRMSGLVGKNILLYFSAHRSSYSRHFLPNLIKAYHEIKARDGAFEVIFISCDEDEASFQEYFSTMPWLALPFHDLRIPSLYGELKVTRIPMLVAIGPTNEIISREADSLIISYGSDAYPFTDEHIDNMGKGWPRKLPHAHHKHELALSQRDYKCGSCKLLGHVWSYFCKECNFDLHPMCALQKGYAILP